MLRVLVVDDSEADRETFRRFLARDQSCEYEILEAETGEAGLASFREQEPQCVLLDYGLPDIDGIDLAEQLTGGNDPPSVAIIMLTGQGSESIAVTALKVGVQDYIAKDVITAEGITRCIQRAVEKVLLLQQLERQRQELQRFASVVSHDLKAPLRSITAFSERLAQRCENKLDETEQDYLGRLIAASGRMTHMVDDLLDYCRLEIPDKKADVDLSALLEEVLANLSGVVADTGGRVDVDPLPTVHGDPTRLSQVFQNLVGNGLKFRGDASPVVSIRAAELEDRVQISISDNGIGIPLEQHERIFGVFQRLHTRDEYEGTGIGLSLCRRIVQGHGGQIWIDSEPGTGTTFHFTLARGSSA